MDARIKELSEKAQKSLRSKTALSELLEEKSKELLEAEKKLEKEILEELDSYLESDFAYWLTYKVEKEIPAEQMKRYGIAEDFSNRSYLMEVIKYHLLHGSHPQIFVSKKYKYDDFPLKPFFKHFGFDVWRRFPD